MTLHRKDPKNEQINNVLTVEEVAEYLRIPKSSVYKLAQEKRIPCQKVGRHWRFHRETIDRWLGNEPQSDNTNE